MITVTLLLLIIALGCAIAIAFGAKCPVWVPIVLLCIVHLLGILPR